MRKRISIVALLWLVGLLIGVGCAAPPADPCADVSCQSGEVCRDGKCEVECTAEQTQCGGRCVDTQTSADHCGKCGTKCTTGESCSAGKCTTSCPAGTTTCGESCVDTQTSADHCGKCDNKCTAGQACQAGACKTTCATGQTACGSDCVDLQSNTSHCGACDTACQTGEVCNAGKCEKQCDPSQTNCSGSCVDLQSNTSHCGTCGTACQADENCNAGKCEPKCPSDQSYCSETCVNTQTDGKHCGKCGNVCPTGQRCLDGGCSAGWALGAGSTTDESSERAYALQIDKNDNVFVVGTFQKSITFDKTTLTSGAEHGMFVVKIDSQSNVLWAKAASIRLNDRVKLALDAQGDLYIGGTFYNSSGTLGSIELKNPHYTDSSGRKQYTSRAFVAKVQGTDGKWLWATAGGANAQTTTDGIAVNSKGQIYIAGTFVTNGDFPKATFGTTDLTSQGGAEIFLASLDKDGKWVWAKNEGSTSNDYARGLKIDANDNIYVAGYFLKPMTLGATTLTPQSGYDGFIAKMDKDHKWLWAKAFTGSDTTQDLDVDAQGNAYVIGMFSGAVSMIGCRATRQGASDIFAAKISPSGACLWLLGGGGRGSDSAHGIRADKSGNAYITGRFYTSSAQTDIATFGSFQLKATAGMNDWHVVIAKIEASGKYSWAVSGGGKNNEYPQTIGINSKGVVQVAGYFREAIKFGSNSLTATGGDDIFFTTLDDKGTYLSAAAQGGKAGGYDSISDMARDKDGNLYVVGTFGGTITFGKVTLQSRRNSAFVGSLDKDGTWRWVHRVYSNDPDGSNVEIHGVAVDKDGNVAITGAASSSTFGTLEYKARGSDEDLFVAKLDKDGKWLWVTGGGGGQDDASGHDVACDNQGNIYVAGKSMAGTIGGVTFTSAGGGRAIVARLDKDGKWQWIAAGGNNGDDETMAVAVDDQGNVTVAGRAYANKQPLTFGSLSIQTSSQARVPFAARLDKDGKWQWVSLAESGNGGEAFGVAIDAKGQAYVAGNFDGELNLGSITIKSAGSRDGFIAALATDGKWQWAHSMGGPRSDRANDVTIDSDGHVLITGMMQGTITLGSVKVTGSEDKNSAFILALDSTGKALWGKAPKLQETVSAGEASFEGRAIVGGPNGSAIIAGQFLGTASFGDTELDSTGASDLFVWLAVP